MIIDKLESIFTAEEHEILSKFEHERKKILINDGNPVEKFCDIENAYIELENTVRNRYIDSFSDNPDSIFQDIQEIVEATEKQEFLDECQKWLETLDDIKEFDSDSPKFETLLLHAKQSAAETYENCCNFILNRVLIQFDVIHHYQLDDKKMYEIIRKKVSEWYEPTEQREKKDILSIGGKKPKLKSILPKAFTMSNTKLCDQMLKGLINDGETAVRVGGTKKKPLEIIVTVVDEADEITTSKSLTMYEECVKSTVYSLFLHGHPDHNFTPEMVVRAMNGKTETEYISPQEVEETKEALEHEAVIRVTINATAEAVKRKAELDGECITEFEREGYLLPLEKTKVTAGGKTVEAYHILKEPVELEYARMTGQLITAKSNLLDVKKVSKTGRVTTVSIKSNAERISIKFYLMKRIKIMKNDRKKKQSNVILFSTLFEVTNIPIQKDTKNMHMKFWTSGQQTNLLKGTPSGKSKAEAAALML